MNDSNCTLSDYASTLQIIVILTIGNQEKVCYLEQNEPEKCPSFSCYDFPKMNGSAHQKGDVHHFLRISLQKIRDLVCKKRKGEGEN